MSIWTRTIDLQQRSAALLCDGATMFSFSSSAARPQSAFACHAIAWASDLLRLNTSGEDSVSGEKLTLLRALSALIADLLVLL